MAIVDLVMPKMGESIMEATILKWLKNPGDLVKMDETLLEIATDKVDSEVPSTSGGILTEILFKENDVVPVGTVIARIENSNVIANTIIEAPSVVSTPPTPIAETHIATPTVTPESTTIKSTIVNNTNRFYSPLVLNIAATEGVSMADLEKIIGTGAEGRVTKKDILNYVSNKGGQSIEQIQSAPVTLQNEPTVINTLATTAAGISASAVAVSAFAATTSSIANSSPSEIQNSVEKKSSNDDKNEINTSGNVEIIEMDRMRKLIAAHMVKSVQTAPHVTSFAEADVTNIVKWREKIKGEFEKKYGEKITYTPLFIEALVNCIRQFPMINSSVDGDKIIIKKDINIGMAAALPSGNLIVPVIKNADTKNLLGLTKDVNGLAFASRQNKLKADDTQNGTFTLTNVGTFGSLMGTPIINQPQVAIMAVGSIKKRPVVLETADGDVIAIRHMMYLSLSYDHRIVDGSLGASFLTAFAKALEAFDIKRIV